MKKLNIIDREFKGYRKELEQRKLKISTNESIRAELLSRRSNDRRKILIKALSIVKD